LKTLKNIPICIQLNHAGRKGSSYIPWIKKNYSLPKNKGWTTISSSNLKKDSSWPKPKIANKKDIKKIINDFYKSAKFAIRAGVDAIELHMAHGYLIHQFLSPVSNNRIDEYGGSFQKRSNLALEITKKIKKLCNSKIILGARITGEDHVDDGLEISDAINLSKKLEKKGIDYVCISSGGIKTKTKMNKNLRSRRLKISKEIKKNTTTILVGATGNMGNVGKLNHSIVKKEIDFAFVGRPFLRNSNWLIEYFSKIRKKALIPNQYSRGFIK
jgi:2,4-dienoyl-CoA reductase-like NADH-dependent reductase (Old Yellow Enzyme family)